MRWQSLWVGALVLALGASCAHEKIPGTEIDDTKDTRELINVIEKYRSAVENKDTAAIMDLLAPEFRDSAGTPTPDDDLDYKTAPTRLPLRFAKVQDIRVQIDVKKVDVKGSEANAIFYYTANYKLPSFTSKAQSDADLKQMWFRRENGRWKILTGI